MEMQTKCCKISLHAVLALTVMRKLCKEIRSRWISRGFLTAIIVFAAMKNGGSTTTRFSARHGMSIIPLGRSSQSFISVPEI